MRAIVQHPQRYGMTQPGVPTNPLDGVLNIIAAAAAASGGLDTWAQLNAGQNTIQSVFAPSGLTTESIAGPSGQERIQAAWPSFAWNSNAHELILFGGGHANTSCGQVFRWRADTRQWELGFHQADIVNVSTAANPVAAPVYRSKDFTTPVSAHTYGNNAFLHAQNRFWTFGGAAAGDGGHWMVWDQGISGAQAGLRPVGGMSLDMSLAGQGMVAGATGSNAAYGAYAGTVLTGANAWRVHDWFGQAIGHPSRPRFWLGGDQASHIDCGTATEVVGGKDVLYWMSSPRLVWRTVFHDSNPANDLQTVITDVFGGSSAGQGQFSLDSVRRVLLTVGNPNSNSVTAALLFADLKRPFGSGSWTAPQLGGSDAAEFVAQASLLYNGGLTYNKVKGCFVFWGMGRQVWEVYPPGDLGASYVDNSNTNLTPTTGWTVVKPTMATGSAAPRSNYIVDPVLGEGGILGKWRWADSLRCAITTFGNRAGEVWAYVPAGWTDPRT